MTAIVMTTFLFAMKNVDGSVYASRHDAKKNFCIMTGSVSLVLMPGKVEPWPAKNCCHQNNRYFVYRGPVQQIAPCKFWLAEL